MTRTKTITTVYEARALRKNDLSDAEIEAMRVKALLAAHPEIGVLCRNGKPMYYVSETVHASIDAIVSFLTVGR
jgi:hypothetical protein